MRRSNEVPAFLTQEKNNYTCIELKKDLIITTFIEKRQQKSIAQQFIDFYRQKFGEKLQRHSMHDKFMQLGSNYNNAL